MNRKHAVHAVPRFSTISLVDLWPQKQHFPVDPCPPNRVTEGTVGGAAAMEGWKAGPRVRMRQCGALTLNAADSLARSEGRLPSSPGGNL